MARKSTPMRLWKMFILETSKSQTGNARYKRERVKKKNKSIWK